MEPAEDNELESTPEDAPEWLLVDAPMVIPPIRIAFGYQSRVGKDTAAKYIKSKYGGEIFSFSESVYTIARSIQTILGKPVEKDPKLLQWIGMGLRNHYSPDVWVNATMDKIRANGIGCENMKLREITIVTDLRFPNEFAALKAAGFTTVKITRADRPIDRDPNHISETALAEFDFAFTIEHAQAGGIEEGIAQLDPPPSQVGWDFVAKATEGDGCVV